MMDALDKAISLAEIIVSQSDSLEGVIARSAVTSAWAAIAQAEQLKRIADKLDTITDYDHIKTRNVGY